MKGGDNMVETYSTVYENGRSYAEKMANSFRKEGYKVSEIEGPVMVPRGENYYVLGYRFEVDDGRPENRSIISGQLRF